MSKFSEILEKWYLSHRRELPWRDTKDPYKIWISEIILQQTRVIQGFDYYQRFMTHFPTVDDLAAASQDEVMNLWQGLGYYSRARNLHEAARSIVSQGEFPKDYKNVRLLKGVGDYTAAAICSFAYDLPYAVVDGNVYRVLSRYFAADEPIDTTVGKRFYSHLANQLLDRENPALYNQALMDFGALQCTPQLPDCTICPFLDTCMGAATKRVKELPRKKNKTKIRNRYFIYVYVQTSNRHTLLKRRGEKDIWQGLYQPLCIETESHVDNISSLDIFENLMSKNMVSLRCISKRVKHVLSHQILWSDFYLFTNVSPDDLSFFLSDGYLLVEESTLHKYAVPKLIYDFFSKLSFVNEGI